MPKRVDPRARREEILAAAVRVFAARGFAATRVEDVAREAGVAKGSVYLYFDSREALLGAAFTSFAQRSEAVLEAALGGGGDALSRLGRLVGDVLEMLAEQPEPARILLDLWAAGREGGSLPVDMAALYRDYRAAVHALLREAVAAGQVRPGADERHAAVVVGAIEGCLLQWLVDPDVPLRELSGPLTEVLFTGLGRTR